MTKNNIEAALTVARDAGIQAVIGMNDTYPCGGAYHTAAGNSEIVKAFKKFGSRNGDNYELAGWHASKSYKGYMISHYGNPYQNMDMHSARATAESGVLGVNGFPTSVHVYIN